VEGQILLELCSNRTLLAIAVVLNLVPQYLGIHLIHGPLAVEGFFVISGFYMALILSERYDGRVGNFYQARALRIFPMYWAVLMIAWYLKGAPLGEYFAQLDLIDSVKGRRRTIYPRRDCRGWQPDELRR
jgi:peptidoglycan/LPS O-acetylase OafA/YrhL